MTDPTEPVPPVGPPPGLGELSEVDEAMAAAFADQLAGVVQADDHPYQPEGDPDGTPPG